MIILSHFSSLAPASLANHRHYARMHGYRHEFVDASAMPQTLPLRALYRYEVLLNRLRHAQAGQLVLLLSENAAIIDPFPLERLMAGRDMLLVRTDEHDLPQVDVQIWRNTPEIRDIVLRLVKMSRVGSLERLASEASLFAGLETRHYVAFIDGICPVMQSGYNYDPLWSRIPTFAISIDDQPQNPELKAITPRFRDALVEHVNRSKAAEISIFPSSDNEQSIASGAAERSTYNPGHKIAIVTLYTPNIESYACIAEANFRRYCEAQGYTLYVHRDIPQEIGMQAFANWFKPWLLHAYLQHHEWVIWLDADVLITNQRQKLEPLLAGRDWVLAHDIGQWLFNSGVMGFRHTERNDTMLRELMEEITAIGDKSDTYASNGDQDYFVKAIKKSWQAKFGDITDVVSFNTPWIFRQPDSFIVHYYGMWHSMRAMMMAHDNALLS